jgi:hypothetical protein
MESIDWSRVYITSSADEQVTFFNHAIPDLFEKSVPLRRAVRRPNVNPWFARLTVLANFIGLRGVGSWRFRNRVHCLVRRAN